MTALIFTDKTHPNACIFGNTLCGGKKRSDDKGVGYYTLHSFECKVFKICRDDYKKFVLDTHNKDYSPLNGDEGTTLSGGVGFLEYVDKAEYLERHSKKHPPKYRGDLTAFTAKGKNVICHLDKLVPLAPPLERAKATINEVQR
jgi:hypothetical protein